MLPTVRHADTPWKSSARPRVAGVHAGQQHRVPGDLAQRVPTPPAVELDPRLRPMSQTSLRARRARAVQKEAIAAGYPQQRHGPP